MERYKEGLTGKGSNTPNPVFNIPKPKFRPKDICSELTKVSNLNTSHFARGYLLGRGVKDLSRFYFCPNFKEWTNNHKQTFDSIENDEPRIIIPLKDEKGVLFGFQGRALNFKSKLRYITIMLDEDAPKIYGLDQIDKTKEVYVVEGPFDSTFINNAIAMCGSDVDLSSLDCKFTYIFDNEPRNKQIVKKVESTIRGGDKVVIWPSNISDKDINDMVLSGHDVGEVIKSNTFKGLEAQVKFTQWKKV